MSQKIQNERVMVVKACLLKSTSGIDFLYKPYIELIKNNFAFIDRAIAESDYNYKQIIPYAIIFYNNKIYAYQRTRMVTEKRLSKLMSIAIGGHINFFDGINPLSIIDKAMHRELQEELWIGDYKKRIVAIINDDSDNVGKVHLGIVYKIHISNPSVKLRDVSLSNLITIDLSKSVQNIEFYENWSKLCLLNIKRIKDR